ncbi:MAG: hypothetical protein GWP91_13620, partial [Rhodobacterales bacterium]|nr:hypothetical protein [Rhodobacterales bacterium]
VIDVGTVARLSDHHFRLTGSSRLYDWVLRHKGSLNVDVQDPSDEWSTIGIQGPLAWQIAETLCPQGMTEPAEESTVLTTVRGVQAWLSRHSEQRYEIEVPTEQVISVWDVILKVGEPQGLVPCGLDAVNVLRVEAGMPLLNVDFRDCSPKEAGLQDWVDDDRAVGFLGQDVPRNAPDSWSTVAIEITWEHLESLYASYGQAPTLLPKVSDLPVPVYDRDGRAQVGQITSATWSPSLKTHIAIAQVRPSHAQPGTHLRAEHTVAFGRRQLPCVVVLLPWTSTPEQAAS